MRRRALMFLFMAVTLTSLVVADDGAVSRLQSNIAGLSLGYVKVGSREVGSLAWHPDFKLGPYGLGADVNLFLGQDKPIGYDNLVLRYLEYNDGKKGLRYGVIENLTWGHGLLLDKYSTRAYGTLVLNNEQLAYLGFVDLDSYVVRALLTKRGLYGVRVEERINPMLRLGQTYIADNSGVTPLGTTESQKISGLGLDATVPLPLNFEGFAEYAQLIGKGSGYGAGLSWGYDMMVANASFLAEYRVLDKNFVPGYYGPDYETNPINLSSAEATGNVKNGYLAKLDVNALGLASLKAIYEKYNDSNSGSLNADLTAKLPQDVEANYYYKQPNFSNFRSLSFEDGAILGGSLAYPINPFSKVVLHYKKAYNPITAKVEESQYYELRLSF
ncbi:hypothetical protein HZB07_01045 [Candidatus Saganbacteria bacterium]|nr:hypothetical protein [Candidatus Saganbacteria bacterium]